MNKLTKMLCSSAALLAVSTGLCAQQSIEIKSEKATIQLQVVSEGLEHPWGLAFLGDGKMLVTERAGRMRYVNADGSLSEPLSGLPDITVAGQGGLLDVILHPQFAKNNQIFFSYNEPGETGSSTAVARATLTDNAISDVQVIFSAQPKFASRHHFGGRLVFADNGDLFITLGDRGQRRDDAQTFDTHHGKVVRVTTDGSPSAANPYLQRADALSDVWSYGHRNIQGAALHPQTRQLWTHEHGPQGGDEINIARADHNYGWPEITYGEEYGGGKIGKTKQDGMEQPLHYWVPSIAPSGMTFYTGELFKAWQQNLLVGSLKFGQLVRLELSGEKVTDEERIMIGQRIRDVRQGPDGAIYLLTDQKNGQILRLTPIK
ncbi:Glucose/arabinose dehydrogenase, beta-propeller fold [Arsukibacterium tuosuense]|uniref:Glucose/arabinose dehydrogenase, beta-propeller fold n=1 Tax=Arsukibacterium tuosuense TaxID=1323745 RepID=A0A285IV27_9GAMM|nr:PQQ-dependent sugar dehydrogenase [Arsukibacterium tuosuense]SNY50781.1 Glucose/arabinose dehydrogenase, beta-propeller fold [Arsukibacterium tuosuense]